MMIISFKISDTLMSQWEQLYKKPEKANVRIAIRNIFYVEGSINSVN